MVMKKFLAVSIVTASLMMSGVGAVGAEELPTAQAKQTKENAAKLQNTPEFQAIQALNQQRKDLNEQLKAMKGTNQALWDAVNGDFTPELRQQIKAALAEIKPLKEANKALVAQLKEAKADKDQEKAKALKAQIEANHQAIQEKLAPVSEDLAKLKELRQTLKEPLSQIKPIRQEKKANHEQVKQLRTEIKDGLKAAKEAYKAQNEEALKAHLDEVTADLQALVNAKEEIIKEKQEIGEILKSI